jgi:hypothetical protein
MQWRDSALVNGVRVGPRLNQTDDGRGLRGGGSEHVEPGIPSAA